MTSQSTHERFVDVYKNNLWGNDETFSGPGSTLKNAENDMIFLKQTLKTLFAPATRVRGSFFCAFSEGLRCGTAPDDVGVASRGFTRARLARTVVDQPSVMTPKSTYKTYFFTSEVTGKNMFCPMLNCSYP